LVIAGGNGDFPVAYITLEHKALFGARVQVPAVRCPWFHPDQHGGRLTLAIYMKLLNKDTGLNFLPIALTASHNVGLLERMLIPLFPNLNV
jgi:hypothetical protein